MIACQQHIPVDLAADRGHSVGVFVYFLAWVFFGMVSKREPHECTRAQH